MLQSHGEACVFSAFPTCGTFAADLEGTKVYVPGVVQERSISLCF